MNHKGTTIIETERLILRPFTMADADPMYRNWASDPEVTKYLTWPTHSSMEVSEKVLESWCPLNEDMENYQWAIVLKEINEPIGSIAVVKLNNDVESADIGYCMGRNWWGQDIMPEALKAIIDFLFNEVGFNRIAAAHDVNNPKSGRVMQKAGMTYEGTWRAAGRNNIGRVDEAWYSILKDEYRQV
ncbi:MAG: GNAT family N-acetyltransferase [Eubacteriales bacterium]